MTYLTGIRITLTMISYNKIIIWLTIRSTPNNNKNTAHSWAQPKNTYVDLNCPVKSLAWLAQHTRWKHIWKMQSPMQVVLKSRKQVVELKVKVIHAKYCKRCLCTLDFWCLAYFHPKKYIFKPKLTLFSLLCSSTY